MKTDYFQVEERLSERKDTKTYRLKLSKCRFPEDKQKD